MDLKKYFSEEAHSAQQNFLGADGFSADAVPYMGADGDDYFSGDGDYFMADSDYSYDAAGGRRRRMGGGQPVAESISQPIILNISNSSASALNVVMFGANYNLLGYNNGGNTTNFGNATGITVTPALSSVSSYAQILVNTQNTPMKIGIVYIQNLTSNTSVLANPLTIVYNDGFGNSYTRPSIPKFDPYQLQNGVIEHLVDFMLDGTISVGFQMPASSNYQFSYYPQAILNPTRNIAGRSAIGLRSRPEIARLITSRR